MKKWEFVSVYNTKKKEKEKLMFSGVIAEHLNSMKDETDYSIPTVNSLHNIGKVIYFQKKKGVLYYTIVKENSL